MIIIEIPTRSDYWGTDTTAEQARAAATSLKTVLEHAAKRLGVTAEINLSEQGGSECSDEDSPLHRISEWAWQDDAIQAAALDDQPVDALMVLKRYNEHCRRNGGTGFVAFDHTEPAV